MEDLEAQENSFLIEITLEDGEELYTRVWLPHPPTEYQAILATEDIVGRPLGKIKYLSIRRLNNGD